MLFLLTSLSGGDLFFKAIGLLLSIGAVIWYLSRELALLRSDIMRIGASVERISAKIDDAEEKHSDTTAELRVLRMQVNSLPCVKKEITRCSQEV